MSNRRPAGRLPVSEAYWNDLATRVIDATFADDTVSTPARWWAGAADAAIGLATAAGLALIIAAFLLPERVRSVEPANAGLASALSPTDPLLMSLLSAPGSPPADALVGLVALRGAER